MRIMGPAPFLQIKTATDQLRTTAETQDGGHKWQALVSLGLGLNSNELTTPEKVSNFHTTLRKAIVCNPLGKAIIAGSTAATSCFRLCEMSIYVSISIPVNKWNVKLLEFCRFPMNSPGNSMRHEFFVHVYFTLSLKSVNSHRAK